MPTPAGSYSLRLYSSLFENSSVRTLIRDITPEAVGYYHTIRLQGGCWQAGFRVYAKQPRVQEWLYQRGGAHVEEWSSGVCTWSGFVAEVDSDEDERGAYADVLLLGYAHYANALYVTAGATGNVRPSAWITTLISQVESKASNPIWLYNANLISDNSTIYVRDDSALEQRIFDEIMRITELGDNNGNPWRFWIDGNRQPHYEQISTTPLYYVRGGVRRRWAWETVWNSVGGTYTDSSNASQTMTTQTNAESIARYGKREYKHYANFLTTTAAAALVDTWLKEYGYPQPRAVGTRSNTKLYTSYGQNVAVIPWLVQPGVVRDSTYPVVQGAYRGFLSDNRDFLADEVEASADGVSLRTWLFSESDLLETKIAYAREIDEIDLDLSD